MAYAVNNVPLCLAIHLQSFSASRTSCNYSNVAQNISVGEHYVKITPIFSPPRQTVGIKNISNGGMC